MRSLSTSSDALNRRRTARAHFRLYPLLDEIFQLPGMWLDRFETRRHLARLDSPRLDDIGIDREQADMESRKPFWRT